MSASVRALKGVKPDYVLIDGNRWCISCSAVSFCGFVHPPHLSVSQMSRGPEHARAGRGQGRCQVRPSSLYISACILLPTASPALLAWRVPRASPTLCNAPGAPSSPPRPSSPRSIIARHPPFGMCRAVSQRRRRLKQEGIAMAPLPPSAHPGPRAARTAPSNQSHFNPRYD